MTTRPEYAHAHREDAPWYRGFASRKEAVAAGFAEYGGDSFYVGEIQIPDASDFLQIDIPELLEAVAVRASDECAGTDGIASDFALSLRAVAAADGRAGRSLLRGLQEAFDRWCQQEELVPSFYFVNDVRYIPGAR